MSTPETIVCEVSAQEAAEGCSPESCCEGREPSARLTPEQFLEQQMELARKQTAPAARPSAERDWSAASLRQLCDEIVGTHHAYIRNELPRLGLLAERVAAHHGAKHPEIAPIQQLIGAVGEEVVQHMSKEEHVLFPFIVALENSQGRSGKPAEAAFATVSTPIAVMIEEHEETGDLMAEIRELTGGYTAPVGACRGLTALYRELAEFDQDLYEHMRLESKVLFPRAKALEAALAAPRG